jgi:hypothetical protein
MEEPKLVGDALRLFIRSSVMQVVRTYVLIFSLYSRPYHHLK